jgi:fluoride exporter
MKEIALVFMGAGVGGVLRYGVTLGCAAACGVHFPWGTFAVNVIGSLLMGLVAAWLTLHAAAALASDLRLLLATGILGGFTTFSAFSLDAMALWERGEALLALGYVTGSVVVSIAALVLGFAIVRGLA